MSNYFEDQINTGQPIVPPAPPAPEIPKPPTSEQIGVSPIPTTDEWKGLAVRASGDRVFILRMGKKYWVSSPEVYNRLGFKFGDEVRIDQATLDVIPEGEVLR